MCIFAYTIYTIYMYREKKYQTYVFSFWSPLLDCDDGDGCCACCFEYGWWWCTTLLLLLLLLCMCTLFALLSVGEPGEILPARAFKDWSIFIGILLATGSRCLPPSASFILEEDRITRRFRFEGINPQTLTTTHVRINHRIMDIQTELSSRKHTFSTPLFLYSDNSTESSIVRSRIISLFFFFFEY